MDFDFGEHGQIDGFDAWRLARFAGSRLREYGFADLAVLNECFNAGCGGAARILRLHPSLHRGCGLTIHSSRSRFAARLNSGVRHQVSIIVNWYKTAKLSAALFLAQVLIGVLDGLLAPPRAGIGWFVGSSAASLVACGVIFAGFAYRQNVKPFLRAWVALLLYGVAGLILELVLPDWLTSVPPVFVAVEWFVLICALLAGTTLGFSIRHASGDTADT